MYIYVSLLNIFISETNQFCHVQSKKKKKKNFLFRALEQPQMWRFVGPFIGRKNRFDVDLPLFPWVFDEHKYSPNNYIYLNFNVMFSLEDSQKKRERNIDMFINIQFILWTQWMLIKLFDYIEVSNRCHYCGLK